MIAVIILVRPACLSSGQIRRTGVLRLNLVLDHVFNSSVVCRFSHHSSFQHLLHLPLQTRTDVPISLISASRRYAQEAS